MQTQDVLHGFNDPHCNSLNKDNHMGLIKPVVIKKEKLDFKRKIFTLEAKYFSSPEVLFKCHLVVCLKDWARIGFLLPAATSLLCGLGLIA